jgi:uncharacterized lipoprotein NlpE involved in copper resistance/heat shock protein HslJ
MEKAFIVCLLATVLAGCLPRAAGGAGPLARPPDAHSSRDSLDWAGTYAGVLPCADCPGIETRLRLEADGSYELTSRYQDRQMAPLSASGRFAWNAAGSAIALEAKGGGMKFAVGENRLVLLDRDGTVALPPAPYRVLTRVAQAATAAPAGPALAAWLEAHRWSLDDATDAQGGRLDAVSPSTGRRFVFGFAGSRVHVQGGCNAMNGSARIDAEGRLDLGRMATTMMACEPAAMRADAALSQLLSGPLRVERTDGPPPVARWTAAGGETLVLRGEKTPEARYGAATRVFLEVAAQRVACSNPLTGATSCLQVRERRYDEKGLVVGSPGEWRPLYESIEGYAHNAGERNVLRVKRFQRTDAPPGSSPVVYVLDLKVESEIVRR